MDINEALARLEIQNVLWRYARGVDRVDHDAIVSAYHPGATDDHSKFSGPATDFARSLVDRLAHLGTTGQHHITNMLIKMDSADDARVESYFLAFHPQPADESKFGIAAGRYLDHFQRRDGKWAISSRQVVMDWTRDDFGGPPWPGTDGSPQQGRSKAHGDPSYEFLAARPDTAGGSQEGRLVSGRVAGKVAFITGAARGQGRSHAIRLAEEGADIIAVDLCEDVASIARLYPGATEADLTQTVREVEALGRRIFAARADVRDYQALKDALDQGTAELGRLDIVLANAGVFGFGNQAHLVEPSQWADVIDINLTGTWHTVKAAIPALVGQGAGGSIIITSSTAAHKGNPHLVAYASSKLGQVGMMRTLAAELGPHRIRVNTVHPTGVATDMVLNESVFKLVRPDLAHPTAEQAAEVFITAHALPVPWVEAIDVSNAVLFLASDEARYITGIELKVDAGYTL